MNEVEKGRTGGPSLFTCSPVRLHLSSLLLYPVHLDHLFVSRIIGTWSELRMKVSDSDVIVQK